MPVPSSSSSSSRQRSRSQDADGSNTATSDAFRHNKTSPEIGRSTHVSPSRREPFPASAAAGADQLASSSRSVSASSATSLPTDTMPSTSQALSARRPSAARSEASAKMKATLSAASSDKSSTQRAADRSSASSSLAATPSQDCTLNGTSAPSPSISTASRRKASAADRANSLPPNPSSSKSGEFFSNHPINAFRAEHANLPAIPVQAHATNQNHMLGSSHFHNLGASSASHEAGSGPQGSAYLSSQDDGAAAPFLTSPSRSAPLPASNGSATASNATPSASPNGRIRSQTAAVSNGASPNTFGYAANGSNVSYHGSRSMRTSPQMRAAPHHPHALVPSLYGMGSSVMTFPSAPSSIYGGSGNAGTSPSHHQMHAGPHWERHASEIANCVVAFLSPILPTEEEYRIKEATRRQLERLANRVSPGAKLLAFGSMANGFALRNSDMDLCCLMGKGQDGKPATQHTASELVEILGQLIREETDFSVMPLPKARIPIIKINRSPTADLPYEIACDIGFENRLALENTRLLLSYAMVDPQRLRTLVLFIKVWAKRRKLNSPYMGTLSSYGYTLMVLFFLTHVKKPAVLPNLQRIPPTRTMKPDEMELNGNDIYFYDDVAALRKEWSSQNTQNVGELLVDFFRYFSKEFSYARDVISLKSETGLMNKDSTTWNAELCIEDPFQKGYNVSRTVTKDGLYTIRGEFMRASRYLTNMRGQKISVLIAELCEEREDGLTQAPDNPSSMQRHPYNTHFGMGAGGVNGFYGASGNGGRQYRDTYGSNRRHDAPKISGYGGSFAFEQMARGLSQGVAYPPTAAMLAPLSRTHGLSPKPQAPRFAAANGHSADAGPSFGSAQSDSGAYAPLDFTRASIGHASARTSPSCKHAVPNAFASTNGVGAQEAFAYGSEISFGGMGRALTRDDSGSTPRNKTSRSFSETLSRSKSLPRAVAMANGQRGNLAAGTTGTASPPGSASLAAQAHVPAAVPLPDPATFFEPGSLQTLTPSELESRMATLTVHRAGSSGPRRLSNSSRASSSAQFDSNSGSNLQCSSASSPWSSGHPVIDGRRPSDQQQADTHALVEEYLRRAAQLGNDSALPIDADKAMFRLPGVALLGDLDDEDSRNQHETGSVISEGTLDELARLSELDDLELTASPEWRAVEASSPPQINGSEAEANRPPSPRSSLRLPETVLQQAKMRKKVQQHAMAAAAAAAAVSSGIARKDRENNAATRPK